MAILAGVLVVLVIAGIAIAKSGRSAYVEGGCQKCGKPSQLNPVTFRYNIGMLVARRYSTLKGALCKSCIHRVYWKYTGINLSVGWLGYISLFAAPGFQIVNTWHYLRSLPLARGLPAPTGFGDSPPAIG